MITFLNTVVSMCIHSLPCTVLRESSATIQYNVQCMSTMYAMYVQVLQNYNRRVNRLIGQNADFVTTDWKRDSQSPREWKYTVQYVYRVQNEVRLYGDYYGVIVRL